MNIKSFACLLLFLFVTFAWLAACTLESETAVSPTLLPATATTLPPATAPKETTDLTTAMHEPTNLPRATSILSPSVPDTPTPPPVSLTCPESNTVDQPLLPVPTNLVRILFLNDDLWLWREETGVVEPLTSGGNVSAYLLAPNNSAIAYVQDDNLWLWVAGQSAAWLTKSNGLKGFLFASDGDVIAFSRVLDDGQFELWAINSDGSQARLLATVPIAETLARYPNTVEIGLSIRWVNDTHTLAYHLSPILSEPGGPPLESISLVNADTGTTHLVLPAATYGGYSFSPDSETMLLTAAADGGGLILMNMSDGRIELELPGDWRSAWTFSPDGRYLIVSSTEGAVLVDTADYSQSAIPVPFRGIGVSHYSTTPPNLLQDKTTWYFVTVDGNDAHQPGATFTLWQINPNEGTAIALNSYRGSIFTVTFSPDQRFMTFRDNSDSVASLLTLHLVETATGQDMVYDNGRYSLGFDQWLSDSTHFVYHYQNQVNNQRCFLLGHVSQPAIPLDVTFVPRSEGDGVRWLDDLRLILQENFVYSESATQGTLIFQSLNGEKALIGDYLRPNGKRPYSNFIAYFEEP